MDAAVRASMDHARRVARRQARSFYWGMRLTPEPKRSALFAMYAWMAAADQLGDGPGEPRDREARLRSFEQQTRQTFAPDATLPDGPIWPALRHVVQAYGLPSEPLWGMLDGQREDIAHTTYASFDDLRGYCVKVAATVGQVCVHLWGHDGHDDLPRLVEQRGVALQLTNILRDIGEDTRRGRCFVPHDESMRFGLTVADLRDPDAKPKAFAACVAFQADRARRCFAESAALESHLHRDCRASSTAIAGVYRALLERLAADPSAIRRRRLRVPAWTKMRVVAAALRQ